MMTVRKANLVVKAIAEIMGDGFTIEHKKVDKGNVTLKDGFIIRSNGENMSPVIYTEDFEALSSKEIAKRVVEIYNNTKEQKPEIQVEDITNFFNAGSNIFYQIVSSDTDVTDLPHREFLDLKIIYKLQVFDGATTKVTYALLKTWDITEKQLWELAKANTPRLFPKRKIALVPGFMEVLTNESNLFGASTILYDDALTEICEEYGVDEIVVIPSSIHEVIIVFDADRDNEGFDEMVREVNSSEVLKPEEILSNHIYRFNPSDGLYM